MTGPTKYSEPTTIIWLTLPRNGNGGAAIVKLRLSTCDSSPHDRMSYLLGDRNRKPRFPLPSIYCSTLISKQTDTRSDDIAVIGMLFDMAGASK